MTNTITEPNAAAAAFQNPVAMQKVAANESAATLWVRMHHPRSGAQGSPANMNGRNRPAGEEEVGDKKDHQAHQKRHCDGNSDFHFACTARDRSTYLPRLIWILLAGSG